jgi:hypothetical protein
MKAVKEYKFPDEDSLEMVNLLRDGVDTAYFYNLSSRISFSLDDYAWLKLWCTSRQVLCLKIFTW